MQRARRAYGALIRAPVVGPVARLPLRLWRWFIQDPDLDASTRADRMAAELTALREQMSGLALAHEALCRDQERSRLILFMISSQLDATQPHESRARLDSPRPEERRAWTATNPPTARQG